MYVCMCYMRLLSAIVNVLREILNDKTAFVIDIPQVV